jgi:hypothetical protein
MSRHVTRPTHVEEAETRFHLLLEGCTHRHGADFSVCLAICYSGFNRNGNHVLQNMMLARSFQWIVSILENIFPLSGYLNFASGIHVI